MATRIRVLSQYFYPDTATTGQLLTELAQGLSANCIDVEVITGLPTYTGAIQATRREVYGSINIVRLPSTRLNKNSKLGKISNSVTFFMSSFIYLLFTSEKSPLCIVSNPPFLPLIGYILRKIKHCQYIFLVHDVYPDIAIKLGYLSNNGITQRIWHYLNTLMLRSASQVVVLGESMKEVILKKMTEAKIDDGAEKISVIHNWADGEFIHPMVDSTNPFRKEQGLEGKFVVQYSGNLGLFHDLECLIEAARILKDSDCVFLFIGGGGKKNKLQAITKEYGLSNVIFLPYLDRALLPFSMAAADVSIVTLELGIEGLAMPSKLYTILASGKPIIGFCDEGSDIADIIDQAKCGFALRQGDAHGLVQLIRDLKSDPVLRTQLGENARSFFESHFTFQQALHQYEKIIKSVQ